MDGERSTSQPHVFDVPPPPILGEEEGKRLIEIALNAIRGQWNPAGELIRPPEVGPLLTPAGTFVTIYRGDSLRGCLGIISSSEPLWRSVKDIALAAATRDPRFDPVSEQECDDLTIEVSVLGPLIPLPLADPELVPSFVKVGEHGLVIRFQGKSGLLLPQVPVRYGWDSQRFLEEVCFKAGFHKDTWRQSGVELLAFRCTIFKGKAKPDKAGA